MDAINRVWSTFADREAEAAYRAASARGERVQLRIAAGVTITAALGFIAADHMMFGLSTRFYTVLAVRILFTALIAGLTWAHGRLGAPGRDRVSSALLAALIVVMVAINLTRASTYLHHTVLDVLAVVGIYVLMPVPLRGQAAGAAALSLAIVVVMSSKTGWTSNALFTTVAAILLANAMGAGASWQIQRQKRLSYATAHAETAARESLELALDEVRTLQGIIPICSTCRKVRNDDGYWEKVESYVRARTEADFSHGICPSCFEDWEASTDAVEGVA